MNMIKLKDAEGGKQSPENEINLKEINPVSERPSGLSFGRLISGAALGLSLACLTPGCAQAASAPSPGVAEKIFDVAVYAASTIVAWEFFATISKAVSTHYKPSDLFRAGWLRLRYGRKQNKEGEDGD
ncbi:Uncharacterised protein [uncultured archaeon]|nr:Uncharacterised protein [uncultured archaeon]